jgi:hypothetical protein
MMDSKRLIFHEEGLPPHPPPLPAGEREGVRAVKISWGKQDLVSETFSQFG